MYFRPRHRRGAYPLAREHTLPRGVRLLLATGAAIFAAYLVWTLLLRILGIAGGGERAGAMLMVEDRGTVTITIDGKQQRAENGMMIFPGESVSTGPTAHASLQFFDGSRARLNDGTELALTESSRGESSSHISMNLKQGSLWLLTADSKSFSGSVLLTVTTPTLSFEVSRGTEATLSPTSLAVYADEGEAIQMTVTGHDPIMISEGQQWAITAGSTAGDDLYALRSPLDPVAARTPFVLESRQRLLPRATGGTSASANATGDVVTLISPAANATLTQATVDVRGTAAPGVTSILVNGYPAVFDAAKGTFSQQLSPPDGTDDIEIRVQALDAQRNVLGDIRRMVKRAPAAPLPAPAVTVPAKTGQTYRTNAEELILRGTAPAGTRGIMVNEYKLQLFDPAKGEWSYVASIRLKNMVTGTNTYDIYALDAAGKKSEPARITIVQGSGQPDGVVNTSVSSAAASATGPLPTNAPLLPGSLTVTLPTPGTTHSETGTGFLIEGATSAQTSTIAVNDYVLQLYKPGKTTWNYIAEARLNNLKTGKNVYVIVARNAKQEILDQMTYTVEYAPQ